MELQAFLCDAAETRENLLFVLGGGVTRVWREQLPAPLNIELAMLVQMHRLEAQERHNLRIVVQAMDGELIAQLDAEFGIDPDQVENAGLEPGETLGFPVVVPLRDLVIANFGSHSVEILIDGQHRQSLAFVIATRPGATSTTP